MVRTFDRAMSKFNLTFAKNSSIELIIMKIFKDEFDSPKNQAKHLRDWFFLQVNEQMFSSLFASK